MLRTLRSITAIAAVLTMSSAQAESLTDYLSIALNADRTGPTYQYDLNYRSEGISVMAHVNPSKPQGARVEVLSPPKFDWNDDLVNGVKDLEADPVEDFWCSGFADIIPRDARLTEQTGTTATYTFNPVPDPDDRNESKLMKHLVGLVTVSKQDPQILSIQLTAPKPFKPVWVAKITRFDLSIECDRTPDGRTHMRDYMISIDGKVALQTLRERERRTVSNIRIASR